MKVAVYYTCREVQYLGVVLTSDGRRNREINSRIGKANAILRELNRYVVTKRKRKLSSSAKLSVFKPVFVPILTWAIFMNHG